MSKPDHPGVIAPPPLVFLATLTLGLAIDFGLVRLSTGLPSAVRLALAAALAAVAIGLLAAALGGFRRAGTRPEPWKPSTALVATGVYRVTRNPMYLGMALAYLALALVFDSGVSMLLTLPLIAIVDFGVIRREERYMEAKFGEPYRAYLGTVRRWL